MPERSAFLDGEGEDDDPLVQTPDGKVRVPRKGVTQRELLRQEMMMRGRKTRERLDDCFQGMLD